MCEPVSISMGVLAVAGAVTSIIGSNTQRQQQKGYQTKLQIANQNQMALNSDIGSKELPPPALPADYREALPIVAPFSTLEKMPC